MKKITVSMVIVVLTIVLSGCGCKHEWEEATCEKPKTCKLCGETEGEPLEHLWLEASCESPRKCSKCGKTEGEALGHDFAPATLDTPKTCRVCGETEGEPLAFRPVNLSFLEGAEYISIISDSRCVAVTRREDRQSCLIISFYDLDGNKVHEQTLDTGLNGWCYSFVKDVYLLATGDDSKVDLTIYDYNFEPILEKRLEGPVFSYDTDRIVRLDSVSFDGIYRVYRIAGMKTYFGVDLSNRCECSPEEYFNAASKHGVNPDYDTSKWSYHSYDEMINGYVVGTTDGSSWGYVDLDENEIKMFKDATSFTPGGYTLVSNDGKTYDLIDADMNIIAENVVEGKGVLNYKNSNVFQVYSEDGSTTFYTIN